MLSSEVQAHHAERASLMEADRAMRSDHRLAPFISEEERKADVVLRGIRAAEAASIWNVPSHDSIKHPFPGMEFLTAREQIVQTRVFEILVKMPKGGLLHAHLDSTVNAAVLLKLALEHPCIHVKTASVLNASTVAGFGSALPTFQSLPEEEAVKFKNAVSLTDSGYKNEWVSITQARASFDPALGGPEGFDKWVLDSLTIRPEEAYDTYNTPDKIWIKFESTFGVSEGLILYAPIFCEYVRQFLLASIEDGISYVEPRVNFMFKYMYGADGRKNIPHREWLIMFDKTVNAVKAEMEALGRADEFFGAKVIYSTLRLFTPEEMEWWTEDCLTLKQEFPHLIAGFDLVGQEDQLLPLTYYLEPLLKFQQRQKEIGVDIPFIFHAGETLGDGTKADDNLFDAILLGTKRIGHGFSLVKHPKLMEICRERGIAVEVCPISNEILRLTSSMPMHPLPILLNNGVPVALCCDDPAVFSNLGLSYDFFQVFVSSELTGLTALGEMARDSIRHSTLETGEKKIALANWEKRWLAFVTEVAALTV